MNLTLSRKLFEKLKSKGYRDEYVAEHVRTGVALQIRTLREQRRLTQSELADLMGTSQSAVARAEDPDYGKLTINTLLDVARAMNVALSVKFLSFPEFIWHTRDVSPKALEVKSFDANAFAPTYRAPTTVYASASDGGWIAHAAVPGGDSKHITTVSSETKLRACV
jgi:transcriptional regulator with XRE-family HTH domain